MDACNCFGHNYKGYQRAIASNLIEKNKMLWFPKLYKNKDWLNSISNDEKTIEEEKKTGNRKRLIELLSSKEVLNGMERIVFAYVKDSLGKSMYKFKGVFIIDENKSRKKGRAVYKRIKERVETYNKIRLIFLTLYKFNR